MERYHPEILVVTQGSLGGFIWKKGQAVRYPVYPVQAIDTNGAGDTFHGLSLIHIEMCIRDRPGAGQRGGGRGFGDIRGNEGGEPNLEAGGPDCRQ